MYVYRLNKSLSASMEIFIMNKKFVEHLMSKQELNQLLVEEHKKFGF